MRAVLSLKPSNANSASQNATSKNMPLGGGKLTRQVGTSNLRREVVTVKKADESPLIKFDTKENFEVYEDPVAVEDVPVEEQDENKATDKKTLGKNEEVDNNFIHELERKMEEKGHAQKLKKLFLRTRDDNDTMSRHSEPPSEVLSVSVTYDDDDDKISVASSTFTTTVRTSFSKFRFDTEHADLEKEAAIRKKIEKEERDDAMFSSEEYASDIIKYMMHRQSKLRPLSDYFSKQPQLNVMMRAILIDWFSDVVKDYQLKQETLHLAVNLVDRTLSLTNIAKIEFQLVGTTSLMMAAKYEEILPPEIQDFAVITDNTYTVGQILRMERFLLSIFDYSVGLPTAAWFGAYFAKKMEFTFKMTKTIQYLLDLSLIDAHFLKYRPSDIAAAAACFTNVQLGKEAWPDQMIEETGIKTDDFVKILELLHRMYINASTSDYKSIFNKYCETEEKEVALVSAPTDTLLQIFPEVFRKAPQNLESSE